MRFITSAAVLSLVVTITLASAARAALISPVAATASTFYSDPSGAGDIRSPIHAIDLSGLTGNQHTNLPGGGAGNADPDTMWLSDNEATPTITFELGAAPIAIDGFHLWNYNEVTLSVRGVQFTNISVSDDNATYTPLIDPVSATTTFTFTQATGLSTYTGEDYALPQTSARYVRFTVIDNFSAVSDYTGLAEIAFTTVVPEPAAVAGLGLFGLSAVARNRRRGK